MGEFQAIGKLLPSAVRRAQIRPQVEAENTNNRLTRFIKDELGPGAAGDVRGKGLRGRTYVIAVSSSGLKTELRLREPELLQYLNQGGSTTIERIRYESL